MAHWEYQTLYYGALGRGLRRWLLPAPDPKAPGKGVGGSEFRSFSKRITQALRLLGTALKELDGDGWELVSVSFSGVLAFYGVAVVRRPAARASA
jgi:hypothetical protein